jgi:uncharacterized protein (DUF342 family)
VSALPESQLVEPGVVWAKDGKVFIRDPGENGPPALISPGQGIRLIVNGTEQQGLTPVYAKDKIEIIPETHEEPGKIAVLVAPNKMKAYLDVRLTKRTTYRLADTEPQQNLVLEGVPVTEELMPLDKEGLHRLLAENHVTHGILEAALASLYEKPTSGRLLIAEGKSPEPPVDEKVLITCCIDGEARPVILENGTADYRNLGRFPSVEAGAVLAVKQPGIPGKPGFRVDGEPVPPPPPKTVKLEAGPGATLSPDAKSVIATVSGRPVIRQTGNRYLCSVEPYLKIKGDVDLETGHIIFKGHVEIAGSVREAMRVEAAGKVFIGGEVAEATIVAEGDIVARSIIGSTVRAGGPKVYYEKVRQTVTEVAQLLTQALRNVEPTLQHAAARGRKLTPPGALLMLIDSKYQRLPQAVKELVKLLETAPQFKVKVPPPWRETISSLNDLFLKFGLATEHNLENVLKALKELVSLQAEVTELASGAQAGITAQYVLNSDLEATGNVQVTGQGAFNSNIRAGGGVKVLGIFRGGEIEAQDNVFIGLAGSDIAVKTVIKVASNKKIEIKKSYPGVVLYVGRQVAEITKPQREIHTSLDSEGRLEISAISWEPETQDKGKEPPA